MGGVLSDDEVFAQLDREDAAAAGRPGGADAGLPPAPSSAPASEPHVLSDDEALQVLDRQDEQLAKLSRYRAEHDAADPAARAQVLKYSAATGIPPDLVERNLDQVKRRVDAFNVDWVQLRKQQPGLAKYLDDRPEGHPLAQEDLENLHGIEWALKGPGLGLWDAAKGAGLELQGMLHDFLRDNVGLPMPGEAPKLDLSQGLHITDALAGATIAPRAPTAEEQRADTVTERGDYGATSLPGKMLVGSAKALPVIGEYVAAAQAGVPGVVSLAAAQLQRSTSQRLTDYRTPDGEKLNPDDVYLASHLAGLVGGVAMAAPIGQAVGLFGKGAGMLPGTRALVERFAGDAVDQVLAQGALPLIRRAVTQWGFHTLNAGLLMGLQGAAGAAGEEGAKAAGGVEYHLGNITRAFGESFIAGMRDMAFLSLTGPGMELLNGGRQLLASRNRAENIQQLAQGAADSKMLALSPEETERAVAAMAAQPGAAKAVHVPVEQWNLYWQGHKVDPGEVANRILEDGGKAYAEASATGGDVSIPVEKFVAKLGKTEHVAGLAEDIRLDQPAPTAREAKAEEAARQARYEEQAKLRGSELERGKQEVHDWFLAQAKAGGEEDAVAKANAKLISETAGTWALRTGLSVEQVAALGAFNQLSIFPKSKRAAAVSEAARERFGQFLEGTSAAKQLQGRLETMAPEAVQQLLYRDTNTGLLNDRAFRDLPAPADKPLVGHVSVEGIKYLNEGASHEKADLLYRTVGKALGEVAPTAAKVGGDFAVRVKDQAELDQLLQRVREKLPPAARHFELTGAVGEDLAAAGAAHWAELDRRVAAGERANPRPPNPAEPKGKPLPPERPRGLPAGVDAKALELPAEKAATPIPPELQALAAGLGKRGAFEEAYLDHIQVKDPETGEVKRIPTGILSAKGWEHIERRPHVASIDVKGLRAVNERYGAEVGDRLIHMLARHAAHLGGERFDFSHLHGDEFAAQANDPADLERWLADLHGRLQNVGVEITLASGETARVRVDFRHGIGRTYELADQDLAERKRAEEGPGSGSGQPGAGGQQGGRDQSRGSTDPAERSGVEFGRGARPQAWPGAEAEQLARLRETDAVVGHIEGQTVKLSGVPPEGGPDRVAVELGNVASMEPAGAAENPVPGGSDKKPAPVGQDISDWSIAKIQRTFGVGYERAAKWKAAGVAGDVETEAGGSDKKLDQPPGGGGEKPARGHILFKITPEGRPVDFRISALEGDKSTLAHETAHFLSWSLHEIATSDLASPDIREDYQRVLKFMGYDSPEDRIARNTGGKTDAAAEEKFSHAWEQYLAEGKAPAKPLQRVFSRFKTWMLSIYKGLSGIRATYESKYGVPLQLSDEVRGVFDRLLATDESLTEARRATGRTETADPEVLRAMTPEERQRFRDRLVTARLAEEQELASRMEELQKKELGPQRERLTAQVAGELDALPIYKVQRYLQRGELPDGAGGVRVGKSLPDLFRDEENRPLQLSREKFTAEYGADAAAAVPPNTLSARKDARSADELAPLFGYDSGAELAAALVRATPREEAIAKETQRRMDERYGPALERLKDAAMDAIHNDTSARAAIEYLRDLAKQLDPAQARRLHTVSLEAMKDTAKRMISATPVGALNPERYQLAEKRTADRATLLWGRGKKAESLDEREASIFNGVMYRAVRDTVKELERAKSYVADASEELRARMGKADPSYRDVHDLLVAAVELGPGPDDPERAVGLDAMLAKAQADFQELDFDKDLVRKLLASPAPWDRLTAEEAARVEDAVKNIRTAARRTYEVKLGDKVHEKDAFFIRMAEFLSKRRPLPPEAYTKRERTLGERAASLKRGVEADLVDVGETLAHMLDAGERHGPAHELLVDGRLAARSEEARLTKEVLEKVVAAYSEMPAEMRKLAGTKMPELQQLLPTSEATGRVRPPQTRDVLYSLFLNWGNEGNRQRIRDGNGWSDDQVQRALNLLRPEEAKFLQRILDVTDKALWEKLAKVYEGRTGLQLPKVGAAEISVNGERYAGGYMPIRYDERASRPGELQADAETVAGLFQGNYQRPAVSSGHTKERAEKVNAAVLLDWNVLPAHLAHVIHDVAYGDWVRSAGQLVLDKRFKDRVTEFLGPERMKQFVPWLQDVANSRADSAAGALSEASRTIGSVGRARLATAAMAFNLKAVGLHTWDPYKAVWEDVGLHRIAYSYLKVLAGGWGAPEFQRSAEIAARDVNFAHDLRQTLDQAGLGEPGLWRRIAETQFRMYHWIDRFTSRVTFRAAHDGALSDGASPDEALRRGDDAVRRTLASHDVAERPRLMRTKSGWGAIVMFYGYANRGWNQRFRARDDIARLWMSDEATVTDKAAAVSSYAAKMLALAVIGTGAAYLAGRGPKKKDVDEGHVTPWAVSHVLLEPLHEWPIIGGVAEKLARGERADARTEPGLAYALDTLNRVEDLVKKSSSNTQSGEQKVWFAVDTMLGLALGGQVQDTADYAHQLATGQARPRGAGDVASGLIYGQRQEPVSTLLSPR